MSFVKLFEFSAAAFLVLLLLAVPVLGTSDQEMSEAEYWFWKGTDLGDAGNYEDSIIALDKSISLDPTIATAWLNKGNALYALDRNTEALKMYEQYVVMIPEDPIGWEYLGDTHLLLNHYWRAAAAYNKAHELSPEEFQGDSGFTLFMDDLFSAPVVESGAY